MSPHLVHFAMISLRKVQGDIVFGLHHAHLLSLSKLIIFTDLTDKINLV